MVETEIRDGRRIAELLASEIDGRRSGPLARLAVTDPDRSVEGTPDGERAYDVRRLRSDRDPRRQPTPEDAGRLLARVYVHDDHARVDVLDGIDAAARRAEDGALQVRSEPSPPPRTVVFVERAADVKRAADALAAASETVDE